MTIAPNTIHDQLSRRSTAKLTTMQMSDESAHSASMLQRRYLREGSRLPASGRIRERFQNGSPRIVAS